MKSEIKSMTPLLQVFDMPRALGFYRDILGFEVVGDSGKGDESSWVWLRFNGIDLMLNDQYEPGHVPDARPQNASDGTTIRVFISVVRTSTPRTRS